MRISGSNAAYSMFRGSVKGTGNQMHLTFSHFTYPPVCHRVPSYFNWTVPAVWMWLPTKCKSLRSVRTEASHKHNQPNNYTDRSPSETLNTFFEQTFSPVVTTNSQTNPYHSLPAHTFNFHSNIILPFTARFQK